MPIGKVVATLGLVGPQKAALGFRAGAIASTASIDFNVSESAFENDASVINLVAAANPANPTLVSAEDAISHLNETLGIDNGVMTTSEEFGQSVLVAGSPWYAIS